MIKKNNATCSICGKGYYMCQSCKDQLNLSPWKIHTDTSEHYKIFQIVRGYSIGLYTKEEAKNKFKHVDLSDLETFYPEIKSVIKSILAKDMSNKTKIENTDNDSVDENKKKLRQTAKTDKK